MKTKRIKAKKHLFPYSWELKSVNFTKDKGTVFSCFSSGGGSSMGYKLAGFDVIGCNEIDKRMMNVYQLNLNPKYAFLEPIQTFKDRIDLPKELYNLDVLDGSPPCFEAGTLIYTKKGYKEIETIKVGDKVLTHNNRFKKVIKVMSKKTNSYFNIKTQGTLPYRVTGNHPFYVRTMCRNHFGIRVFAKPEWKEVKDLQIRRGSNNNILEQDYIGIAINKKAKMPKWDGVTYLHPTQGKMITLTKNTIDFNRKDFWYMVGRFIGDGWVRYVEKTNRYSVIICCGKHEKEELQNKLDKTQFKYNVNEERTNFKFTISSKELASYLLQFKKGAANKELTNDILDLPIYLLRMFLKGYLDADCHYEKRTNTWSCASVSKKLIVGIQQCIAKVYHQPTTITTKDNSGHKIEGRIVNTKLVYSLSFHKKARPHQHGFYEKDYLWVPFREKKFINKKLTVYNLEVAKDESYTAHNLICHNCSTFSTAGDREKVWGKKKKFKEGQSKQILDTLFFDFIDLAKKLQPKVVIAENVKGLMMGRAIKYLKKVHKDLDSAGYVSNSYLLDSSKMGVPQKRERVFVIGIRKDLANQFIVSDGLFNTKLNLDFTFNEKEIPIKKFVTSKPKSDKTAYIKDRYGDLTVNVNKPSPTLVTVNRYWLDEKSLLSDESIIKIGTFPTDYRFTHKNVLYLTAMSVPPVMMAQVANRIYEQILSKIK